MLARAVTGKPTHGDFICSSIYGLCSLMPRCACFSHGWLLHTLGNSGRCNERAELQARFHTQAMWRVFIYGTAVLDFRRS